MHLGPFDTGVSVHAGHGMRRWKHQGLVSAARVLRGNERRATFLKCCALPATARLSWWSGRDESTQLSESTPRSHRRTHVAFTGSPSTSAGLQLVHVICRPDGHSVTSLACRRVATGEEDELAVAAAKASGSVLAWRGSAGITSAAGEGSRDQTKALSGDASWFHGMPGCDRNSRPVFNFRTHLSFHGARQGVLTLPLPLFPRSRKDSDRAQHSSGCLSDSIGKDREPANLPSLAWKRTAGARARFLAGAAGRRSVRHCEQVRIAAPCS